MALAQSRTGNGIPMNAPLENIPAVEVQQLIKVYGSGAAAFTALKKVDMTVRAGELVMIVGPSGSGKTTLLSILGCVLSPTSGTVKMFGTEISGADQAEQARLRL